MKSRNTKQLADLVFDVFQLVARDLTGRASDADMTDWLLDQEGVDPSIDEPSVEDFDRYVSQDQDMAELLWNMFQSDHAMFFDWAIRVRNG